MLGGDHPGQEAAKSLNCLFHFNASFINGFCGMVNP
jgi:hypothetical protein